MKDRVNHRWTAQQEAIFSWFTEGTQGNLIIDARAGSSKTTTLFEGTLRAPEVSALLCAYNKKIALEMESRVPEFLPNNKLIVSSTLHSIGYSIVRHFWYGAKLDAKRTEKVVRKVMGEKASYKLIKAIVETIDKVKETCPLAETVDDVMMVGEDFDTLLEVEDKQSGGKTKEDQSQIVLKTLDALKKYDGSVAFSDMTWLPVVMKEWVPPSRYRLMAVDEAQDLSPVQLLLSQRLAAGRMIYAGDRHQCHPIGTLIRTSVGDVPIEDLDPEIHLIVPYNQSIRKIVGVRKFEKASRFFKGEIINITCGNKTVQATPEHKFLIRYWTEPDEIAPLLVEANDLTPQMLLPDPEGTNKWLRITGVIRLPFKGRVYSLEVEMDHLYSANGIVVHNCIYGWRGADQFGLARLQTELNAKCLPLTVSFRCAKEIINEAQNIVSDIQAAPWAPVGKISWIYDSELAKNVSPGCYILSRLNAPLAAVCLKLRRQGIPARIEGADTLQKVKKVFDKLEVEAQLVSDYSTMAFYELSKIWMLKELAAAKKSKSPLREERAIDVGTMLMSLSKQAHTVKEIKTTLESLFKLKNPTDIICMTVHKAKGLEADRVFLLRDSFPQYRHLTPSQAEDGYFLKVSTEEKNIEYVAITRARQELIWVSKATREF